MSDHRGRIEEGETWLTRLGKRLPGYQGHLEREQRRDADRLLRAHLCNELDSARKHLQRVRERLVGDSGWELLGRVDEVERQVRTLIDRIRSLSAGYSGWFDAIQIKEAELDRVYQFDLQMLDMAEQLAAQLSAAADAPMEALPSVLNDLETAVRDFAAQIEDRESVLRGLIL